VIGLLPIASKDELIDAGATWTVKDCSRISFVNSTNGQMHLQLAEAL